MRLTADHEKEIRDIATWPNHTILCELLEEIDALRAEIITPYELSKAEIAVEKSWELNR